MDSEIGLVHIENGEGGKGRYAIPSQSALKGLKKYYSRYKPNNWLFRGTKSGQHTAFRIIQAIFKRGYKKASIKAIVPVHSLGHSFTKTLTRKRNNLIL